MYIGRGPHEGTRDGKHSLIHALGHIDVCGWFRVALERRRANRVGMNEVSMRLPVRALLSDGRAIDVHDAVVRAIEHEISGRFGGNSVLNRLEAEAQLAQLLGVRGERARRIGETEASDGAEE
jgi:hypothetical protein